LLWRAGWATSCAAKCDGPVVDACDPVHGAGAGSQVLGGDGTASALLECGVRPMPPWSACVRGSRANFTFFFWCGVHVPGVQQYEVALKTVVGDGAPPASRGCCVAQMSTSGTCARASLRVPHYLPFSCVLQRATVCGGYYDIGVGWCITCPLRMPRQTNTAMEHLCASQPTVLS